MRIVSQKTCEPLDEEAIAKYRRNKIALLMYCLPNDALRTVYKYTILTSNILQQPLLSVIVYDAALQHYVWKFD